MFERLKSEWQAERQRQRVEMAKDTRLWIGFWIGFFVAMAAYGVMFFAGHLVLQVFIVLFYFVGCVQIVRLNRRAGIQSNTEA
jgi:hypothetical protein